MQQDSNPKEFIINVNLNLTSCIENWHDMETDSLYIGSAATNGYEAVKTAFS